MALDIACTAAAVVPVFGMLLSVTAYYFLYFFFQPTIARFEFVAQPSFRGYVNPYRKDGDATEAKTFTLLPGSEIDVGAWVTGTDGKLNARWNALSKEQLFTLQLYLVSDCGDLSDVLATKRKGAKPFLTDDNIRSLRIGLDEGLAFFDVARNDEARLSLDIRKPTFYWVQKAKKDDGFEMSYYLVQPDVLTRKARETTEFFIRAPLQRVENDQSRPISRSFSVALNGGEHKVTFDVAPKIDPQRKVKCHFIDGGAVSDARKVSADATALLAGLYVKIEPIQRSLGVFQPFDNELKVSGLDGQFSTEAISPDSLEGHKFGSTDLLAAVGDIKELKVDGSDLPSKPGDFIHALGSVNGEFIAGGRSRFSGVANLLWQNSKRINKTRWEKLSTEWQLAMLGWIGALAFALFRLLGPTFRRLGDNSPYKLV